MPRCFALLLLCGLSLSLQAACNDTPFQIELIPAAGQSFPDPIDRFRFVLEGPILQEKKTDIEIDASSGKLELSGLQINPDAENKNLTLSTFGLDTSDGIVAFGTQHFLFSPKAVNRFRLLLSRPREFGWVTLLGDDARKGNQENLPRELVGHQVTRLKDGTFLLSGGARRFRETKGFFAVDSAGNLEKYLLLYDPQRGNFSQVAQLENDGRIFHTASLLPNGHVMIAGGFGFINNTLEGLKTTIIYDPDRQEIYNGPALQAARGHHTANVLSDGAVLFLGGSARPYSPDDPKNRVGQEIGEVEIYNPTTKITKTVATIDGEDRRILHQTSLFSGDTALITGGLRLDSDGQRKTLHQALLLKRNGDAWTIERPSAAAGPRFSHTATLFSVASKEVVLVAGGQNSQLNSILATLELWDSSGQVTARAERLSLPRYGHAAIALPGQREILIVGGGNDDKRSALFESEAIVFDEANGNIILTLQPRSQMLEKRGRYLPAYGVSEPDKRLFLFGGASFPTQTASHEGMSTAEFYTIPPSLPE